MKIDMQVFKPPRPGVTEASVNKWTWKSIEALVFSLSCLNTETSSTISRCLFFRLVAPKVM